LSRIVDELRRKGYRVTPQRLEVVRAIWENRAEHPALRSLYDRVRKSMPTTSFSTLYSTVMKLSELGYVKLFDLGGETRIEVNMKPHINIIYPEEGRVVDVEDHELVSLIAGRLNLRNKDFLVNIVIYGGHRKEGMIPPI